MAMRVDGSSRCIIIPFCVCPLQQGLWCCVAEAEAGAGLLRRVS